MKTIQEDADLDNYRRAMTVPEQNAFELADVYTDLGDWLEQYEGKPGRWAMVSTIKAARRYIERAHHAVHAAMLIEKGGDFSQCQEDACGHLEEQTAIDPFVYHQERRDEEARQVKDFAGRSVTVITEADLRAAIEYDPIGEAEARLEGRAFVPMFGRLE